MGAFKLRMVLETAVRSINKRPSLFALQTAMSVADKQRGLGMLRQGAALWPVLYISRPGLDQHAS